MDLSSYRKPVTNPEKNRQEKKNGSRDRWGYFLLFVYLFIEYGRPMDLMPFFKSLRPGMIIDALLVLSWFTSGHLSLFNNSKQTKILWAFIGLMSVYIPFATNNRWAFDQTLSMVLYMPFFLSAIFYIHSVERLQKFFYFWILLMIYISVKGILGKGIAGSSFLADENDFALLLNIMLPFSFFLFLYEKMGIKKILCLIASSMGILGVIVSSSRGGFVGLAGMVFVTWCLSPKKVLALLVAGILMGAFFFSISSKYEARLSSITETNKGTAKERVESWKSAWEMFKAYPLGVGPNNFPIHFPEFQTSGAYRNMWGRVAHSLWFTLIPELGIIGLVVYSLLIIANLRDIFWLKKLFEIDENFKFLHFLSLAFMVSITGYFISGTFLSVLYYPHFFYLTSLIVVSRKLAEKNLENNREKLIKIFSLILNKPAWKSLVLRSIPQTHFSLPHELGSK